MSKKTKERQRNVVPPQRTLTEIDLEALRIGKGETLVKGVCDCVKSFAKWGSILGCFYFLCRSVESVGDNHVVYAISANDPPKADTKVKVRKFDSNDIPGEPMYFIVNPGANRLFCVRPSNMQRLGVKDVGRALQFFMGGRSKHAATLQRMTESGPEEEVSAPDGTPAREPVFRARVKRQKSVLDRVLENPGCVRNLVHTIPFKDKDADERNSILQPLLRFFNEDLGKEGFERTRSVTYKISVDGMQREDVEKAIKSQENASPGQKVGFRLKNAQQTIWADDCLMRRTVDMEIGSENGIYAAADLLASACAALRDWL